jgi:hypothetical protein
VALALLSLSACSKAQHVGLRYQPGEALEFYVPLCGEDVVTSVSLGVVDDKTHESDVFWTIGPTPAVGRTGRVELRGDSADGSSARAFADLTGRYAGRRLLVQASTGGGGALTEFELDKLPTDGSGAVRSGTGLKTVDPGALRKTQREGCGSSPGVDPRTLAVASTVGAAIVAFAVALTRRRSRRA